MISKEYVNKKDRIFPDDLLLTLNDAQRKTCPYLELFWSAFSRIRTEYGEIRTIYPYSVQTRENANQNNSKYGQFSRSVIYFKSGSVHTKIWIDSSK